MTVQTPVAKRERAETVDEGSFLKVCIRVANEGGTADKAATELGMKKASVVQRLNMLREKFAVEYPGLKEIPRFADARGRKANHVDADTLAALLGVKASEAVAPATGK